MQVPTKLVDFRAKVPLSKESKSLDVVLCVLSEFRAPTLSMGGQVTGALCTNTKEITHIYSDAIDDLSPLPHGKNNCVMVLQMIN